MLQRYTPCPVRSTHALRSSGVRCRHGVGRALAPGGVFVSFHEGLSDERTAPEPHVIGRLMPAL